MVGVQPKEIVEISTSVPNVVQSITPIQSPLTVQRQWTDENGYTWRQMSDRSILWWNGTDWVSVTQ